MERPVKRQFTILDAMVMAAATAVGLAFMRAYLAHFWRPYPTPSPERTLEFAFGPGSCLVLSWMVALTALRLRRPHSRLRRLSREPGLVACCAAISGTTFGMAHSVGFAAVHSYGDMGVWSFDQVYIPAIWLVRPAVAGAWIALAVSGRWKCQPDWIDRLGRLFGTYWVLEFIIFRIEPWIKGIIPSF